MIYFLSALALLALFYLQVKTIQYFKWNRFVFYYAELVCEAFSNSRSIDAAYKYTDLLLYARHPKVFPRYYNDNQFKRTAHEKIRRICSRSNLIGVDRTPLVITQ